MALAAGLYRTPVTFQNPQTTLDSLGEPINMTTTNVIQTGARVTAIAQAEGFRDGLEYPQGSVLVEVRYSPSYNAITTDSLMVIRGVTYDIISIDDRMFNNREIRYTGRVRR